MKTSPALREILTRPIATCLLIGALMPAATYQLGAFLPLHLAALGGSKTQIGLLFSISTGVSMVLRPLVGGWNDRYGFRPVAFPGALVLLSATLALFGAGSPAAVIALMAGLG